jgi:hypothetical protein
MVSALMAMCTIQRIFTLAFFLISILEDCVALVFDRNYNSHIPAIKQRGEPERKNSCWSIGFEQELM